jgi:hypothetical protein
MKREKTRNQTRAALKQASNPCFRLKQKTQLSSGWVLLFRSSLLPGSFCCLLFPVMHSERFLSSSALHSRIAGYEKPSKPSTPKKSYPFCDKIVIEWILKYRNGRNRKEWLRKRLALNFWGSRGTGPKSGG